MSPTLVRRDGHPVLTVGAAGGPTIITQSLLAIVRTIDFGQPLLAAVKAPRVHHQWKPATLSVERTLDAGILDALKARGHVLDLRTSFGTCQAIAFDRATQSFHAVSEPRARGAAACVESQP